MIKRIDQLFKGARLHDRRRDRVLVLETRVNPQGDPKPYWVVRNLRTDKTSTIREDRLMGSRYVMVPSS